MATENVKHLSAATAAATQIESLKSELHGVDSIAQAMLDQIDAVARLASAAFETQYAHRNPMAITHALDLIAERARDLQNFINCAAERVGCNYRDFKKMEDVLDARRKAHEAEAKNVPPQ